MKWLVAGAWCNPKTFDDPVDFLSNPQGRLQPHWFVSTVDALDEDSAYELGFDRWCQGELGAKPPSTDAHEFGLLNWIVVPLPDGDFQSDSHSPRWPHEIVSGMGLHGVSLSGLHERNRECIGNTHTEIAVAAPGKASAERGLG